MRPIKFRAWDKLNLKMGDVLQYLPYAGKYGAIKIAEGNTGYMSHDFELMQFTGLLDKNGKEIYEGDILKIQKSHEKNEKIVSCIWGNIGGWLFQQHKSPYSLIDSEEFSYYEHEIIGNIYQNSELL